MSQPRAISGIADPSKARLVYYTGSEFVHAPADSAGYQPLDATLTALAALNATPGIMVQTGADAFTKRTLQAPAAGLSITNPAGTAGDPTFALTNDLAALEALGTSGFSARTGADTWAIRSLTAPAAGLTITNPAGTAGNPTFALANDLAALEGLGSTGLAARTAADTWAQRTLTAPAAGITITNPAGVAGNPTFALADDLAAVEGLASTGFAVRTAANTWAQRLIAGTTDEIGVSQSDGVAGNPTIFLSASISAAKAFRRGNILATVTESAGVPTGGLIERGSNANGEYVRFADGTQICWNTAIAGEGPNTAVGVLFYGDLQTWTFPAAFSASPAKFASSTNSTRFVSIVGTGTTSCQYREMSPSTSATAVDCQLMAVGRWF